MIGAARPSAVSAPPGSTAPAAPDRWALAAGAVPALVVLVMWPGLENPFLTPKAVLAVLGGLGLAAAVAFGGLRGGRVHRPRGVLLVVVAAHAAALVTAAAAHERPLLATVGHAGRHLGLAVALAALVLLLAAIVAGRRAPLTAIAPLLVAAIPAIGYAIVQAIGADPFPWALVEGGPPVFAFLGNTNFFSGWLGIVAPLGVWAALASTASTARAGAGAIAAAALVVAALSGSLQGVVAGGLAAAVVLVGGAALLRGARAARRVGLLVVAALLGSALAGVTTGAWASARVSLANRFEIWEVALRIVADHPWRGVGLAGFRGHFAAYQAAESAAARGLDRIADSPHSVPLDLLVSGGAPLLVTWLALVGLVAHALVRTWRRGGTADRLRTLGLGAAGAAYLAQAAVSLDVAPLAVTGALVAGLALGGTPGPPDPLVSLRAPAGLVRAAGAVVLALVAAVGVAATLPWRADVHAAQAARAGEQNIAVEGYARAASLAPWEPSHASRLGGAHVASGDLEAGLRAYEEAVRRDPRAVAAHLNIGRLAVALDAPERADAAYARAVVLHPRTGRVLAEAGRHALERDRPQEAADLLERSLAVGDEDPERWRDLAAALEAAGESDAAEAARSRARASE
ncbi:hypothetical protein ER308_19240 [Egibacter rhizosphaerae]|uniref:O-antigen ligase-related domain-containing protein n=1 Tax=Egibacter rhizosphaerae TaxID=1670831 RepID=A0A411YJX0_9ACTN|nr:O-antigen ligase family protein [Egibacter rhizosphaerae]QBI21492.1 hypothetical protein ER308_19240 [Egibacter rhizosphaerae]